MAGSVRWTEQQQPDLRRSRYRRRQRLPDGWRRSDFGELVLTNLANNQVTPASYRPV